jgi:hypothetical protein
MDMTRSLCQENSSNLHGHTLQPVFLLPFEGIEFFCLGRKKFSLAACRTGLLTGVATAAGAAELGCQARRGE